MRAALLLAFLFSFTTLTSAGPSFAVDYSKGQFLLDGAPFRYISGSIHYWRIHPDHWSDRLKRVRALGFNAIQTYIPWNFQELERGRFDFSGQRDVARFVQMASDLGLYSILRIGPYICAEIENGGLPYWLISHYPDIRQRTNDKRFEIVGHLNLARDLDIVGGMIVPDNTLIALRSLPPGFTAEVSRYFTVLSTQIAPLLRHNGGPVLMVQIENEYGFFEACDHAYTNWLRDETMKLLGPETVLFTTDHFASEGDSTVYLKCGSIRKTLTTIDFGPNTRDAIEKHFSDQLQFVPGGKGPRVNSEFYIGWMAMWGQHSQELATTEEVVSSMKDMWEMGASFNAYMIHGGTNFGFWNGAHGDGAMITSYDYTAPIRENGDLTPTYHAIREWVGTLPGWTNKPTEPPADVPRRSYPSATLKKSASSLLESLQRTVCTSSDSPQSFEELGQQFGYVLYSTRLPIAGRNLSIERLLDFGYTFVDGVRQNGTFINEYGKIKVHSITIDGTKGALLEILVENQGRRTYETINDFKGIRSAVLLDGTPLRGWTQCGIAGPFEISTGNRQRSKTNLDGTNSVKSDLTSTVGVYSGSFEVDEVADTWIALRGWGKGHVVVNDHNIGRYWSTEGPQYALYVPGPLLVKGTNYVTVVELNGASGDVCRTDGTCTLKFDDKPDIQFD